MPSFLRLALGTALALLLVAVALIWDAQRLLDQPLELETTRILVVPPGATLQTVLSEAQEQGLMQAPRLRTYVRIYARISGLARLLQAGEYELKPGLSASGLMTLLASGRTKSYALTVVEGWRFTQMLDAIRAHPALRQTLSDASPEAIMAALGRPELHPEGRFLPETYRFPRGTTDLEFLGRAMRAMDEALAREWAGRDIGLPYRNAEDALIMASIVERETGVPSERAQIAGVFVRRLVKGMRLQTDPTVIYGLGERFDGNLRRKDLLADTPYNSYTRSGLPPTPICLPGRAALNAALHPAPGEALYFVSRGDGSHYFSSTLAEHNDAVRRYQLRKR